MKQRNNKALSMNLHFISGVSYSIWLNYMSTWVVIFIFIRPSIVPSCSLQKTCMYTF